MHKNNVKFLIHLIVMVVIYLIISNIPPADPLTHQGMQVIGLIVAFVYGRIAIDAVVPSLIVLFLYATTGLNTVQGTFSAAGGHSAVMMVLALMMLGAVMNHTGLAEALAKRIVNTRLASGRPWVLTLCILLAAAIPSMFLTAIPVLIIVWGIAKEIFHLVGYEKGEKWPALIMSGITGAATLAVSAMPFSMGVATDFSIFANLYGEGTVIPSLPFIATSLILCALLLVFMLLIMRFIFRPNVEKLKAYQAQTNVEPFTRDQKRALVLLVVFVVIVLLPDMLPAASPLKPIMAQFGTMGGGFLIVLIALLIRNKDGSPFITIRDIGKGVMWDLLIMIWALMVVCGSLTNPELGASTFFANLLTPIVEKTGTFGSYAILQGVSLFGTNLMDNAVVGMTMASIISMTGTKLGISAVAVFCFIMHSAEYGVLLPSSSPLSAMTYQQTESKWITKKDIFVTGLFWMIAVYIIVAIIGFPLLQFLS